MPTVIKILLSLFYRFGLILQKKITIKILSIKSDAVLDIQFGIIHSRAAFIFPIENITETCRIMVDSGVVMARLNISAYCDDKVDVRHG